MFKKKKCPNCGEKISSNYEFCPFCGKKIDNDSDFGMLGKNDKIENEFERMSKSIFGGMGGKMMSKMISNTVKMMEREMRKEMQHNKNCPTKSNFQLFVNGKRVNLNPQPVQQKQITKKPRKLPSKEFSKNNIKNFSKLPRKEPTATVKRLANKIIYEVKIPGVNSLKDVSIIQLENSIEIKAVSKTKSYFKIIPINLPITNYGVEKGKLILELEGKN